MCRKKKLQLGRVMTGESGDEDMGLVLKMWDCEDGRHKYVVVPTGFYWQGNRCGW